MSQNGYPGPNGEHTGMSHCPRLEDRTLIAGMDVPKMSGVPFSDFPSQTVGGAEIVMMSSSGHTNYPPGQGDHQSLGDFDPLANFSHDWVIGKSGMPTRRRNLR